MGATSLDEAKARLARYRRDRDDAAEAVTEAERVLADARTSLKIAEGALKAAEDVFHAAMRGVVRPTRQLKAETRALLERLMQREPEVFGMSDVAAEATTMGQAASDDALRQMVKRWVDDGFVERLDRGAFRVNRDMAVAGGCRDNRSPSADSTAFSDDDFDELYVINDSDTSKQNESDSTKIGSPTLDAGNKSGSSGTRDHLEDYEDHDMPL